MKSTDRFHLSNRQYEQLIEQLRDSGRIYDTEAMFKHIEALEHVLDRARVILRNMAKENKSLWFFRWPIADEPLRIDAQCTLPEIEKALLSYDSLRYTKEKLEAEPVLGDEVK